MFHNLSGQVLYEYKYSKYGTALILRDDNKDTVSFVDTNMVGLFNVIGVRAYYVYNIKTGESETIFGFDNIKNQYGLMSDYNNGGILISIQVLTNENGMPDIEYFQYGISKKYVEGDIFFQTKIDNSFVFARYRANI